MILAGDIGGTKTRVGLFGFDATPIRVATYPTGSADSLDAIVQRFLAEEPACVAAACFGVAGTVAGDTVVGVNLPWDVRAHTLQVALGAPVRLVNDLEANARGIEALEPSDFAVVNPGAEAATGNRAVVSAGTGLGEAGLVWTGTGYRAFATEGGHADFAPRSELEVVLYRRLARELGHVSYERVCSGAGLANIYRILCGGNGAIPQPAAITAEALATPASASSRALDVFVSIYGARAGNVALGLMATGGVYLGGGIAPKIVDRLHDGAFMRAFVDKGRFAPLLERIPVRVILNDDAALLGAARIAAERSSSSPSSSLPSTH